MGSLFGGGDNDSAKESQRLQQEQIQKNEFALQQKVSAFSALRLNIIKAQGRGSYNDTTINT